MPKAGCDLGAAAAVEAGAGLGSTARSRKRSRRRPRRRGEHPAGRLEDGRNTLITQLSRPKRRRLDSDCAEWAASDDEELSDEDEDEADEEGASDADEAEHAFDVDAYDLLQRGVACSDRCLAHLLRQLSRVPLPGPGAQWVAAGSGFAPPPSASELMQASGFGLGGAAGASWDGDGSDDEDADGPDFSAPGAPSSPSPRSPRGVLGGPIPSALTAFAGCRLRSPQLARMLVPGLIDAVFEDAAQDGPAPKSAGSVTPMPAAPLSAPRPRCCTTAPCCAAACSCLNDWSLAEDRARRIWRLFALAPWRCFDVLEGACVDICAPGGSGQPERSGLRGEERDTLPPGPEARGSGGGGGTAAEEGEQQQQQQRDGGVDGEGTDGGERRGAIQCVSGSTGTPRAPPPEPRTALRWRRVAQEGDAGDGSEGARSGMDVEPDPEAEAKRAKEVQLAASRALALRLLREYDAASPAAGAGASGGQLSRSPIVPYLLLLVRAEVQVPLDASLTLGSKEAAPTLVTFADGLSAPARPWTRSPEGAAAADADTGAGAGAGAGAEVEAGTVAGVAAGPAPVASAALAAAAASGGDGLPCLKPQLSLHLSCALHNVLVRAVRRWPLAAGEVLAAACRLARSCAAPFGTVDVLRASLCSESDAAPQILCETAGVLAALLRRLPLLRSVVHACYTWARRWERDVAAQRVSSADDRLTGTPSAIVEMRRSVLPREVAGAQFARRVAHAFGGGAWTVPGASCDDGGGTGFGGHNPVRGPTAREFAAASAAVRLLMVASTVRPDLLGVGGCSRPWQPPRLWPRELRSWTAVRVGLELGWSAGASDCVAEGKFVGNGATVTMRSMSVSAIATVALLHGWAARRERSGAAGAMAALAGGRVGAVHASRAELIDLSRAPAPAVVHALGRAVAASIRRGLDETAAHASSPGGDSEEEEGKEEEAEADATVGPAARLHGALMRAALELSLATTELISGAIATVLQGLAGVPVTAMSSASSSSSSSASASSSASTSSALSIGTLASPPAAEAALLYSAVLSDSIVLAASALPQTPSEEVLELLRGIGHGLLAACGAFSNSSEPAPEWLPLLRSHAVCAGARAVAQHAMSAVGRRMEVVVQAGDEWLSRMIVATQDALEGVPEEDAPVPPAPALVLARSEEEVAWLRVVALLCTPMPRSRGYRALVPRAVDGALLATVAQLTTRALRAVSAAGRAWAQLAWVRREQHEGRHPQGPLDVLPEPSHPRRWVRALLSKPALQSALVSVDALMRMLLGGAVARGDLADVARRWATVIAGEGAARLLDALEAVEAVSRGVGGGGGSGPAWAREVGAHARGGLPELRSTAPAPLLAWASAAKAWGDRQYPARLLAAGDEPLERVSISALGSVMPVARAAGAGQAGGEGSVAAGGGGSVAAAGADALLVHGAEVEACGVVSDAPPGFQATAALERMAAELGPLLTDMVVGEMSLIDPSAHMDVFPCQRRHPALLQCLHPRALWPWRRALLSKLRHSVLGNAGIALPVTVRRSSLLQDATSAILADRRWLTLRGVGNSLEVRFAGELGRGMGVARELLVGYMRAFAAEVPAVTVHAPSAVPQGRGGPLPRAVAGVCPEEYMRAFGRMLGLCVVHNCSTGIPLRPLLLSRLLDEAPSLAALAVEDLATAQSLLELQARAAAAVREDGRASGGAGAEEGAGAGAGAGAVHEEPPWEDLAFVAPVWGGAIRHLCPDGDRVAVAATNVREYVALQCGARLWRDGLTTKYVTAASEGLRDVLPPALVATLTGPELHRVVCGMPALDADEWRRHTTVEWGFAVPEDQPAAEDSEVVAWFWEVVAGMSGAERARLMLFATGSSAPPVALWESRHAPMWMKLVLTVQGDSCWPTARTCFRTLQLPAYRDRAELEAKMMAIVRSESGGDGLSHVDEFGFV